MNEVENIISDWEKGDSKTVLDLRGLNLDKWTADLKKITTTVTKLNINNNKFKDIPKLSVCETLIARDNTIDKMGPMPKLIDLVIDNNELTKLPGMTKARRILASNNKLIDLPKTVNQLEILDVSGNRDLTKLPSKMPKLRILICSECNLSTIPDLPKLEAIRYYGNNDLEVDLQSDIRVIEENENIDDILELSEAKKSPKKSTKVDTKKSTKVEIKKTPKKMLKHSIIPEEDFEEDLDIQPKKKEDTTRTHKKTPIQKFLVKKEIKVEELNIWDQVPKTFGPISFIPLSKIETDVEAPVKPKKIKEKLDIPIDIEITTETLPEEELGIQEDDFDNTNKFMTNFDINYMPRPGLSGKNRYAPADLREFMKLLGLSSSGYNENKIRIISEYLRLSNVMQLPLNPKDDSIRNIIVKVLNIKKTPKEFDYNAIIAWQNKQISKIEKLTI